MSTIDKSLIRKYLEGNCTSAEILEVRKYLQRSDAQQLFDEVWDEDWAARIKPLPVAKKELEQWQRKMDERMYQAAMEEPRTMPFFKQAKVWRYAAVWLVLILGAGIWTFKAVQQPSVVEVALIERINPNGKRTVLTLPDSSIVHLGPGSTLRFAQQFNGSNRMVELQGEAFFEVTKNPTKPFIIRTGNIATQVLGTSFKIDAFAGKPVSVSVSTGKVRVDRHVNNKVEPIALLLPGEAVTWDEQRSQKMLASVAVADVLGWKEGRLFFNETKLADIADILERWYNVDIKIKSKTLANRLVKVNLTTNISIAKIMNILSVAGDFHYQINGNEILIKNKERMTM